MLRRVDFPSLISEGGITAKTAGETIPKKGPPSPLTLQVEAVTQPSPWQLLTWREGVGRQTPSRQRESWVVPKELLWEDSGTGWSDADFSCLEAEDAPQPWWSAFVGTQRGAFPGPAPPKHIFERTVGTSDAVMQICVRFRRFKIKTAARVPADAAAKDGTACRVSQRARPTAALTSC